MEHPFAAVARAVPAFAAALERHEAGDLAAARAAYLDLIDQQGLTALCLHQLGLIAAAKGDHAGAAAMLRAAIRVDPLQPLAYHNLSEILDRLGDAGGATAVLVELGCVLQAQGAHAPAIQLYQRVLARDPLNYAAFVNAGTGLAWLGEYGQAARRLLDGIILYGRLSPDVAAFARGIAERLEKRIGAWAEAAPLPAGPPTGAVEKIEDALTTLGTALDQLGCAEEALLCHRQSVAAAPGFALGHWNLALSLLAAGDFLGGWKEYEWRWLSDRFREPRRRLPLPTWRRQALDGKRILIWGEQGLAEIIQFAPLVPRLASLGAEVVFEVPHPLLRLFRQSLDGVRVVGRAAGPHTLPTELPLDYALPQMSLPHRLDLRIQDLPLATDYLRPTPGDRTDWAKRLAAETRPKVGIVWTEGAEANAATIPLATLRPLFEVGGIAWHSLQPGAPAEALPAAGLETMRDLARHLTDFADLAAAIDALDLVVATDSAVAHLAAAMGKPTWMMMPAACGWPWSGKAQSSRWYPSVRLFRQPTPGDWSAVAEAVATELAGWR